MNTEESFRNHGINTPELVLNGIKTLARVVKVIDGDTITVVIPLFDSFYKYNIRILGIDAPELHSTNVILKELALKARNRLVELIGDGSDFETNVHLVYLECKEYDKYGRLLCDVYTREKTTLLSNVLLNEKLAYEYSGKRKLTDSEIIQVLQH
jgi:endonuclease YncB( thermonuclease family)